MFWDSVTAGLGVLAYWQTYAAGLEYLLVTMGPMVLVALIAAKSGRAEGLVGCLSMLILPFFQAFGVVVFIMTLAPIILGVHPDAAWSFPWMLTMEVPWAVTKFIFFLLIASIVLAFVPILGRMQSMHTLILGALALLLVIGILENNVPGMPKGKITPWPGFWFAAGILVIGGILAKIGMLVAAVLATMIESATEGEGIGQFIVFPIAGVFGFLPVFIYGAYIGAQLRAAAGS